MTKEELATLAASVTPERLRALALTAWGTAHHRGRTVVPVMALIEGLTAGMDTGDGPELRRAISRLRHAIQAAVQQMPDAAYLPGG